MSNIKKGISLLLSFLCLLGVPIISYAEWGPTADWNEEYYRPSKLKEDECFAYTPREFVKRFNEKNSVNGEWMEFIEEGTKCNLYWGKEQMNMFLQFMDTTDSNMQFGSGLDREKWNKVKVYIDTDDSETDLEYLASFSLWLYLLSDVLDLEFDATVFTDNRSKNIGTNNYPCCVYENKNIRYTLESYDNSIMYFGETTTTYAASIELLAGQSA